VPAGGRSGHTQDMREAAGRPVLGVRLLGGFELRLGDEPLPPLDSAPAASLLAFLLLNRDAPQPRQRIAFALWPDSTEPQARTNLRHLLHKLRRTLTEPERYLEITPRTLRWRPDVPWWFDVAAFDEAAARADRAPDGGADAVTALREAVELYRDDLLPGSYDEWLDGERQRLRGRLLAVLHRLAVLLDRRGEPAEAIGYAERLLRYDPLAEEAYLLLMRMHDARGDRTRALRAYHACAAALERELGTQPSAPVRRLYEKVRSAVPSAQPARAAGRPPARTRLRARWRTAWWCPGCAVTRWPGGCARCPPSSSPSWPGCYPNCSPSGPTCHDRDRCRKASCGSGCSTRWPGRSSAPAPRSCWSPTTCTGRTVSRCGCCTTSCGYSRGPGSWSPPVHAGRISPIGIR
jgi:DNA-binding SARP family transcriptional activator